MQLTVHSPKIYRSRSQEGKYRKNIQTGNESKLHSEQLNSEKCPNLVANLGKCVMNMAENLKFGSLLSFYFSLGTHVKTPGEYSGDCQWQIIASGVNRNCTLTLWNPEVTKFSEKSSWKACYMGETALEDLFSFFSVSSLMTCERKITTPSGCQEDKFINICGELEHYNESTMGKPMRKWVILYSVLYLDGEQ